MKTTHRGIIQVLAIVLLCAKPVFASLIADPNSFDKAPHDAFYRAATLQMILNVYDTGINTVPSEDKQRITSLVQAIRSNDTHEILNGPFWYAAKGLLPDLKVLQRYLKLLKPDAFSQSTTTQDVVPFTTSNERQLQNIVNASVTGSGAPVATGASMPLESRLIYATADLIAERFQAELAVSFFKQFRDDIDSSALLQALLPNTKSLLSSILINPLSMPSLGSAWKGAFDADMRALPGNLAVFVAGRMDLDHDTSHLADVVRVLKRAWDIYQMITHGTHPAEIIHSIRIEADRSVQQTGLQRALRLLDDVSENLVDARTGVWIDAAQLKQLENDTIRQAFVGGIFYQDQDLFVHSFKRYITESAPNPVDSAALHLKQLLGGLGPVLSEFQSLANRVDKKITELKDQKSVPDSARVEYYAGYVETVFDLMTFGYKLYRIEDPAGFNNSYFVRTLVPLGEHMLGAVRAASKRNYGASLADVLFILNEMHTQRSLQKSDVALLSAEKFHALRVSGNVGETTNSPLEASITNFAAAHDDSTVEVAYTEVRHAIDRANSVNDINAVEKQKASLPLELAMAQSLNHRKSLFLDSVHVVANLMRYGSFIVDVISAKNVEDTKSALSAAAAPAGSYSVKRHAATSVAINSYVGLGFGREYIIDATGILVNPAYHIGLSAPIGIDIGWATGESCCLGSVSMFLSVLDLGAVVAFRTTNANGVSATPNIGFAQVFSPGFYFVFGLGKESPASLGVGCQLNPKLRQVTTTTSTTTSTGTTTTANTVDANTVKISAFFSMDIPLFTLYASRTQAKATN